MYNIACMSMRSHIIFLQDVMWIGTYSYDSIGINVVIHDHTSDSGNVAILNSFEQSTTLPLQQIYTTAQACIT